MKQNIFFVMILLILNQLQKSTIFKEKTLAIFKNYKSFSSKKADTLMKTFEKTRASKRLSNSFKMIFDKNIDISESFMNSELNLLN